MPRHLSEKMTVLRTIVYIYTVSEQSFDYCKWRMNFPGSKFYHAATVFRQFGILPSAVKKGTEEKRKRKISADWSKELRTEKSETNFSLLRDRLYGYVSWYFQPPAANCRNDFDLAKAASRRLQNKNSKRSSPNMSNIQTSCVHTFVGFFNSLLVHLHLFVFYFVSYSLVCILFSFS